MATTDGGSGAVGAGAAAALCLPPLIFPAASFLIEHGASMSPSPDDVPVYESLPYTDHFLSSEHINFLCEEGIDGEPMIATLRLSTEQDAGEGNKRRDLYQVLVWTVDGKEVRQVDVHDVPRSFVFCGGRRPIDILSTIDPRFSELSWVPIPESELRNMLSDRERREFALNFKLGVLYATHGNVTEREMFNQRDGSAELFHFMDMIGERKALRGYDGYTGRLDTKQDLSGTHFYATTWRDYQVAWHVSPLLLFKESDPQKIDRKRHIGNDLGSIIFMDGITPYHPLTVRSKQLHFYIVVQQLYPLPTVLRTALETPPAPVSPSPGVVQATGAAWTRLQETYRPPDRTGKPVFQYALFSGLTPAQTASMLAHIAAAALTPHPRDDGVPSVDAQPFELPPGQTFDAGKTYYRVAFCRQETLPVVEPALPNPPIFERGPRFREWILCKMLNADRNTYRSASFISRLRAARRASLERIAERFLWEE